MSQIFEKLDLPLLETQPFINQETSMKSKHLGKFAVRTLPLLISAACATNAFAQSSGVEEVLVSAQKRTERIQDVPMAISAISGQALENRKIEGAADLQGTIPKAA